MVVNIMTMSAGASLNNSYKCRGCMKNKTSTSNLFDTVKSNMTLADMFNVCAAIKVVKNDGLPQRLCNLCTESLTIAYDFRIQCEESDAALRQLLSQEENRSSPEISENLSYHDILKTNSEVIATEIQSDFDNFYSTNNHGQRTQQTKKHTKYRPIFSCKFCEAIFRMRIDLIRHESKHSKDELSKSDDSRPHICDFCGQSFKKRSVLMGHKRIHSTETPFLCYQCGKSFKTSAYLRQHRIRHAVLKPFSCHLCPQKFKCKGALTCHIKTHSESKREYVCDICGRSFDKLKALKLHNDTHTGIKPWKCDSCPKTFIHKNKLERHRIIHTGDKPYQCNYCDRAYNQKNNLTVHLRSHVGENQYECTVCNEKFRLKSELKKHYPIHYTNNESLHMNIESDLNLQIDNDIS